MSAVKELTKQIISLDANVVVKSQIEPQELLKRYAQKVGPNHLWQLMIVDQYQNKYTLIAYYYNCDIKTVKKIHQKTFTESELR